MNYNNVRPYGFEGCQLPCVPKFKTGVVTYPHDSILLSFKRTLAFPWNRYVKQWLRRIYQLTATREKINSLQAAAQAYKPVSALNKGDIVRVRSMEEISSTLNPFKELKGCAFLPDMQQYCGTKQKVFRSMQHFLDERDYKFKKTHGLILLENIFCGGTPAFGVCDRCCFLFWREEWLEKVE